MASDPSFVEYVCEQAAGAGEVSYRKMFGEYALYLGGKVIALVCDDQLFVKPTAKGRALLKSPVEAPPYPGAKPCFLIEELIEDREALCALFRATESELPTPKPKKPRAPRAPRAK